MVTVNSPPSLLLFGRFELNAATGELRKSGLRIRLQGQSLRILLCLVEEPGRLWTREELRNRLWPSGTFVEFDHSLNVAVNRLRERLGDSAENPRFVETVPGAGYRFVAPIEAKVETSTVKIPRPEFSIPAPPRPGNLTYRNIFIAAAGVLFLAGLVWFALGKKRTQEAATNESPIHSVAVLPLVEIGAASNEEYFADGMTEELITELARGSPFRVISRTSIMQYKNSFRPVPQIGRELKVDAVIEGTIRRAENRVRITVKLVGAAPERLIWADAYEVGIEDVLALQRDVARDIARNIQTRVARQQEPDRVPLKRIDAETHEDYLRGRYFLAKRTADGMNAALGYFHRAVQRDAEYAQAYVGLAETYDMLGAYEILPADKAYPPAILFANKAMALDDTLSEAYTARAIAACYYELNWTAANRDFQRAIQLDPSSATAHHWYAEYFTSIGRFERAITEVKSAREFDPLSLPLNNALGRMYREAHHFDEAVQQCKQTLALDPNFSMGHWCLGQAYLGKRQFEDAVSELKLANESGTTPLVFGDLGWAYASMGKDAEARAILNSLRKKAQVTFVSPYLIGSIYGALGEKDEAFKWLDKAYDEKDGLSYWIADPKLDPLRSDPRFVSLIERLHIPRG